MGIRLRSEGCNDADKKPGSCGIAYTYVDGTDKSPHGRGHNVVVVDGTTGTLPFRSSMIPNLFEKLKKSKRLKVLRSGKPPNTKTKQK